MELLFGRYQLQDMAGSGNFSSVHKAKDTITNKTVAVKVMKSHQKIGLRQGLLLKGWDHPNIVKLLDFQQEGGETRMVLEYTPENALELYEGQKFGLSEEQVKCIMFQSVLGLAYIHQKGIIHRDIKPQNILVDKKTAQTKLIDFGLAISVDRISTDYVATRWYRAPENLLGTKQYTTAIDIFALGCVVVELFMGAPLFPGSDNVDQVYRIFNVLGEPEESIWPKGAKKSMELGFRNNGRQKLGLEAVLRTASPQLVDLLKKMLQLDPSKRITSWQILEHQYFKDIKAIIPPKSFERFTRELLRKNKVSIGHTSHRSEIVDPSRIKQAKSLSPKRRDTGKGEVISFRGGRQGQRRKEDENKGNQVKTPTLAFRGFNQVKAAKFPVKETLRQVDNRTAQVSRDNSIEGKGRTLGASIDMAKKLLFKDNIKHANEVVSRRLTADGGPAYRSPDVKMKSIETGRMMNPMGQQQKGWVNKPSLIDKLDSSMGGEKSELRSARLGTGEMLRLGRNLSELSPHSPRMAANEMRMPNFIKQKFSSPIPINQPSHSPRFIPKAQPQPAIHPSIQIVPPSINNPTNNKQSLYTSFSKPFQRLKQFMSPQTSKRDFTERSFNDGSFHLEAKSRVVNGEERNNYGGGSGEFRGREGRQPAPVPYVYAFRGRNGQNGNMTKMVSPEGKIKLVKSLQRHQTSRQMSRGINIPLGGRRESGDARPSMVMVNHGDYRDSRLSTKREGVMGQQLSQIVRGRQENQNKNISINLNLSFVQDNQRRRGRL